MTPIFADANGRPRIADDVPAGVCVVIEQPGGSYVRDVFHHSGRLVLPLSFLHARQVGPAIGALFLMGLGHPPGATYTILCDTMIPAWPVDVATTDRGGDQPCPD